MIVMDGDLQDPPEVVLDLIAKWKEGFEIVYARRLSRDGESGLKRWTASLFYRLLRLVTAVDIPADVGDFRLVDRRALETFRAMPEQIASCAGCSPGWVSDRRRCRSIVCRGLLARPGIAGPRWHGWRSTGSSASRTSPYASHLARKRRLLRRLAYGAYVVWLSYHDAALVAGWASTVVLLSLLSGVNLLMMGIVGLWSGASTPR